jgi:predicted lipoprotein
MRFQQFLFLSACTAILLFASCESKDNPETQKPDQSALLQNIGDNLILAGYELLADEADVLHQRAEAFASDPTTATLIDLEEAWRDAYQAWQKVGFYNFGPAANAGIIGLNIYPTDTAEINSFIRSGTYNLNSAGAIDAKGFPALDYLLYGYADSRVAAIEKFTNTPAALTFLTDVTANIQELAHAVHTAWSPAGGNYVTTFKNNQGTSVGSSLSQLINAWSQYLELHLRNGKIGIPNGNNVINNQRIGPFPEKAEAYYSEGYSKQLAETSVEAMKNFYLGLAHNGTDGVGIYDYLELLEAQNGTLADDFLNQFTATEQALQVLDDSLINAIETQGAEVTDVFVAIKTLVALLKVDVVSALSITITYADNDGD